MFIAIALVLIPGIVSADAAIDLILPATEPWTRNRVDGSIDWMQGTYVSLAHDPITGKAFISYYDITNQDLRLAYQVAVGSGNCGVANDWVCETVDSAGDVGKYSSIDVTFIQAEPPLISSLRIGISYFDDTNDALKHAEATFTTFPTWTISMIEDSSGAATYGEYSSIKFSSDHKPHIAYHYSLNLTPSFGAVKYASLVGDGTGNCGNGNNWICEVVDGMSNQSDYGTHVSLDLDYRDSAHIAYYQPVEGDLYYAFPTNEVSDSCLNENWWCTRIDEVGDVGKYVSIHAPDSETDFRRFAYFDATELEIRYAYDDTQYGFVSFAVDKTGSFMGDLGISMAVDAQGYPIIAYMNAESYGLGSDLKVARPAAAYGIDAGNCGDMKPFSMLPFLYWFCKTIDSGGQMTMIARYADVSVDPSGLAAVAFYAEDIEGRLMFTRQWYTTYLPIIDR